MEQGSIKLYLFFREQQSDISIDNKIYSANNIDNANLHQFIDEFNKNDNVSDHRMIVKILDNLSSDEDTKAQIDIINNALNPPRKKEDKESRPKITADNLTTANLKEFVIINQTLQESIEYESATNKLKGQISVANSVNKSVHESNETFINQMKSVAKGTMRYKEQMQNL